MRSEGAGLGGGHSDSPERGTSGQPQPSPSPPPPPHLAIFLFQVALLIIDEIHLLGADRGPILEVIVSRMR